MRPSKLRLLLPALLLFCLPALAQSAQPANRIVAPVDESNRVMLAGNVHPMAQARFDRGPALPSTPTGRIDLLLQRSPNQQQALTQYLADLQNPGSPNYHKWLTPAQYGAQFGISDSDLATVESWLQAHGFRVEAVPQARNLIQFSGTFGQIQEAFRTSIHTFQVNGVAHFANAGDPQIPAALAPVVAGVGPLNDFHPKPGVVQGPRSHYDATEHKIRPDLTLQDQSGNDYLVVDPADAATIYDSPNSALNTAYSGTNYDGTGVNVGIVGVSNIEMQDITNYRTAFLGEAAGSVNLPTVVVDGNDPGVQPGGAADEALLDNEIAGGLAPKANIYYYAAADTDLTDGVLDAALRAIGDNIVGILSMSFGACESDLGTTGNQLVNEAAQQAAAQGISVVVSAGDNGSAGCDNFDTQTAAQHGFAVSGFASTPYNIAVGGTDFDVLSTQMSTYVNTTTSGSAPYYETAKGPIPEAVWNDSTTSNGALSQNVATQNSKGSTNIVAGSGGVSSIYAKPSYQTSLTPNDNARDLPDVSLFAADGFHFAFWALCSDNVSDGSSTTYTDCQNTNGTFTSSTTIGGAGGTSAAAPAFAGMLALISQSQGGARLGQADYILYQLAKSTSSAFHDVTTSNNSVVCTSGSSNCGSNGFLTGYNAGSGYDTASGLGSVDLTRLVSAWGSASLGSTSTTLNINGSTAAYTGVHGATLTFNVGVNPTTAAGNVAIVDTANMNSGGTLNNGQFSIPLTNGSGTATYNGLPGGTYTVYARYGGDTSNAASISLPAIPVTITPENSTTTLVVNAYDAATGNALSSLTNIPAGDYIFLDAQVLGAAEGNSTRGVATGTVTFYNGTTQLGTASVDSIYNLASWPPDTSSFVSLAPGNYSITAKYSGDPSYNASTSNAVTLSVAASTSPSIFLSNSGNISVTAGSSGISTLTVTPSGGFTGQVNFSCALSGSPSGLTCSAPGTLISGTTGGTSALTVATSSSTPAGTYAATITAFDAATGKVTATSVLNITVGSASPAAIALSNSGNISLTAGSSGTSVLTLRPSGGFAGVVNFVCAVSGSPSGLTCSAPAALIGGTTTAVTTILTAATTSSTPAGSYAATITASDTATGKIASSTTLTITVAGAGGSASIALSNSGNITVTHGSSGTSTVSVTPAGGFTGQVNLTCAVTTTITNPNDPPTCAVTSPVTISGTTAVAATLTANTTGATAGVFERPLERFLLGGGATLAMLLFFGIPARRRAWRGMLTLVAILFIGAAIGCGGGGGNKGSGGGNSGTTPGTYTVTVTGTDAATGKITATTTVSLTVN